MCLLEVRTGFYIPGDGILHRHRREILKSYIPIFVQKVSFLIPSARGVLSERLCESIM
jgi:hypothetical protein